MMIDTIILFVIFGLSQIVSAQSSVVKNGDLLFIDTQCGPMCEAINAVTEGFDGQDFNHVGIVFEDAQHNFFVYEAISQGVVKTPLDDFLNRSDVIYKGTIDERYQYLITDAIDYCDSQLGVPYDADFLYDNGKYYCSELLYDAFLYANDNQPFFRLFPMTYKAPDTNEFFSVWVTHFAQQGIDIPEGLPGCNPGGMSLNAHLQMEKLSIN